MISKTEIGDALIRSDIEGCVQVPRVDAGASDKKPETLVFLDGNMLSGTVSANTPEGWADRCILKSGHSTALYLSDVEVNDDGGMRTERLYGDVIILVCSPKMLHLLQELSKNHDG